MIEADESSPEANYNIGRFFIYNYKNDLAAKLGEGRIHSPVEATYPIEEIKKALAHAQQGGRDDMRKTAGREQDQDRGGKNAPQRSDDGTSNR